MNWPCPDEAQIRTSWVCKPTPALIPLVIAGLSPGQLSCSRWALDHDESARTLIGVGEVELRSIGRAPPTPNTGPQLDPSCDSASDGQASPRPVVVIGGGRALGRGMPLGTRIRQAGVKHANTE